MPRQSKLCKDRSPRHLQTRKLCTYAVLKPTERKPSRKSSKAAKKMAATKRIVDSLLVMLRFSCTACSMAGILIQVQTKTQILSKFCMTNMRPCKILCVAALQCDSKDEALEKGRTWSMTSGCC